MKTDRRLFVVVLLAVLTSGACASAGNPPNSDAPPQAAKLQPGDLKKLSWIVGTWKGTGENVEPFYERYRFDGDQVLVMESLSDASLTKINSTTRYELRDGRLQGGNDSPRVAVELTDRSVTFAPAAGKGNAFQWVNKDQNSWEAILDAPVSNDPKRKVIYHLQRVPAPAATPAKGN